MDKNLENRLLPWKDRSVHRPATHTDLSVYTDFLTFKFGKIQIFLNKIKQNTDFLWTAKGFSLYCPYLY